MKTIIFSGCGGGYDIFGCLPLYHDMKKDHNTNFVFCNLSFTSVNYLEELSQTPQHVNKICDGGYEIFVGNYATPDGYFPEYELANALNHSVFAMCNYDTVSQIDNFYKHLLKKIKNTFSIYLVDCGCDVLLSGNETELATPIEDMMHLKSIMKLDIKNKFVTAIGLNVDCGHNVIEKELTERLKELEDKKIILHKEILSLTDDKTKFYLQVFNLCKKSNTIVHSFVEEALKNNFGYIIPQSVSERIKINDKVFVSELTKTFIICNAKLLSDTIIYFDKILDDLTSDELDDMLENLKSN